MKHIFSNSTVYAATKSVIGFQDMCKIFTMQYCCNRDAKAVYASRSNHQEVIVWETCFRKARKFEKHPQTCAVLLLLLCFRAKYLGGHNQETNGYRKAAISVFRDRFAISSARALLTHPAPPDDVPLLQARQQSTRIPGPVTRFQPDLALS